MTDREILERIERIILEDPAPFPVSNKFYPNGMDLADAVGETLWWYRTYIHRAIHELGVARDTLNAGLAGRFQIPEK